jgi:D-beta-D-heptose 7-phosphate kinase/D-beta-D-heptose 1-phosphate adenosyltransferase
VILVSDYAKGSCSVGVLAKVIGTANERKIPVLVDPAKDADYVHYAGALLVKPNRSEAAGASGRAIDTVADADQAARGILRLGGFPVVVVTLDRDGMLLVADGSPASHFPAVHWDVCDITGAGDTALAMLAVALCQGAALPDCVRLANAAAGLQVQHIGTVPITWGEVEAVVTQSACAGKLVSLADMVERITTYKQQGRRVVFTNGCFDLLHVGHVGCLEEAAALGDVLVVAINSDASVKRIKGESRPIIDQHSRAAMLAALGCVDHVLVFEEDTPCPLLELLRPDVLVKGGTYKREEVVGREIVEGYGGKVHVVGRVDRVSTSGILGSIASQVPTSSRSAPNAADDQTREHDIARVRH